MSGFYSVGKAALFARTIPADALIRVVGVNDAYDFSALHPSLDDVSPHIILPAKSLSNPTFVNALLDGDDISWTDAGEGINDRSLILSGVVLYFEYDDTTVLLAFIDSASAGLPQTLTGATVTAKWSANGILRL